MHYGIFLRAKKFVAQALLNLQQGLEKYFTFTRGRTSLNRNLHSNTLEYKVAIYRFYFYCLKNFKVVFKDKHKQGSNLLLKLKEECIQHCPSLLNMARI